MLSLAVPVMIATAAVLGWLWHARALSANLMLTLIFLFAVGNIELVLTTSTGYLPESLSFIEVADLQYATFLFDFGILAMAAGMWLSRFPHQAKRLDARFKPAADTLSAACAGTGAIRLYAVLFVATAVLKAVISGPLAPLQQLFLPLLFLRFVPIYILAYRYFTEGRDGVILFGVATFEIVVNLSYFSSFARLFIVTGAALMLALRDGARFRWFATTLVAVGMVVVVGTWTYVKSDFREYLSAGETAQIDTRSLPEKINFLADRFERMGWNEFGDGLYRALLRIAYNGFFAATTRHIPARADYTNGAHVAASLSAAVMPRFLFADKPPIDDSEIVRQYTGLVVAGVEEGTSINVGQFGELYGDLGVGGMLAGLLVLGYALGQFEAMFVRRLGAGLDASALTACFVTVFGTFMYSLPKLIAVLLYSWLAAYILLRFVYPHLTRWLAPPIRRMRA
jgi:hypothetical protein